VAKFKESDDDFALNLLVRLRAGETVEDIVQSFSTDPMGDELDVDPTMGFTGTNMSESTITSQILFSTSSQSLPFITLAPAIPPALVYSSSVIEPIYFVRSQ
jgi:hypothetical protein